MRVNIYTSYFGGPYQWGRDLALALGENGIETGHIHTFSRRLAGLFLQNADVVHTTVPFPIKLWDKPIVMTIQGDYTVERNILQRYYPKTMAQADALTTSSDHLRKQIPMPNAVLIPNAIFPEKFKRTVHGTRRNLNLVTVMNLYFRGKVQGLIDVIEALRISGLRDFRYIIVGDGPYKPMIEEYARKSGLNILFSGVLDDIGLVLANSDIFLYCTHQDSFPNVIIEAMASGLPVLSNDFGSMRDIINHGVDGYVVSNVEDYASCLKMLFGDAGLRKRVGEVAQDTVERRFNWHTIVKQFIEIYDKVVS